MALYRLQLALGGAGLLACDRSRWARARAPCTSRPAAAHRARPSPGCASPTPRSTRRPPSCSRFAALGAAVLVVAVRAAVPPGAGAPPADARRCRSAGPLPGHPAVIVIDIAAPLAFCAGWLRPRVYVSRRRARAAVRRAAAGRARPRAPARALRDPLRLAVGRVLCAGAVLPARAAPAARPLRRRGGAQRPTPPPSTRRRRDRRRSPRRCSRSARARRGDVVGISPERVDALLGRPGRRGGCRGCARRRAGHARRALALVWRASAGASVSATLNLPIASLAAVRPRARAGARSWRRLAGGPSRAAPARACLPGASGA